jgi:hypothetical protein
MADVQARERWQRTRYESAPLARAVVLERGRTMVRLARRHKKSTDFGAFFVAARPKNDFLK